MRITLDVDADVHRKIKTLAAVHGVSVKSFILAKLGFGEEEAGKDALDETAYLFSTPANAEHLGKALKGKPEDRLRFETVEDVKRALGI